MKVRLHFNRRGKDGAVWTLHSSKQCTTARKVTILGQMTTEYRPEKKTNPRAYIVVEASQIERLSDGEVKIVTV